MDENLHNDDVEFRGQYPSIIEKFQIEGLYGYRSIGLSSKFAATILIARNGSGKTTLLGALDAFLKCQFSRLETLDFSKIVCRLKGVDKDLILEKTELNLLQSITDDSILAKYARQFDISPVSLLYFVENEYPSLRRGYITPSEHDVYNKIWTKVGYSAPQAKTICDKVLASREGISPVLDQLKSDIKNIVGDMDIVYLPTYRRIELALSSTNGSIESSPAIPSREKRNIRAKLGISKRSIHNADINFGLSDISNRLSELNQEILHNSTFGYRQTSASIISELVSGAIEKYDISNMTLPDKEALALFFSRLKEGGDRGASFDPVIIPDIDKIYSGEYIPKESNKFLHYYLEKLAKVIDKTKDVETSVQEFVSYCNKYLSTQDYSTSVPNNQNRVKNLSLDNKKLGLNKRNLRIHVTALDGKVNVPLDSLSSGEKQMISLFARLYLYPGPKIVLIDEPELSLSINWQRKILLDLVNAPPCVQVVAITHSPFVFDNELEPLAKSLFIAVDSNNIGENIVEDEENPDDL